MEDVKKASLIEQGSDQKENVSQQTFATTQVVLPSKGKLYPVGHPLHDAEFIEIKEMTAKEEDILTSRILLKKGTAIDRVLENCIVNKKIDQSALLVGDRNTILLALRMSGYGAEYKVNATCPLCNANQSVEFSLNNIKVRTLDDTPDENGLFEIFLPKSQTVVKFKFLTAAEETDISKTQDNYRKLTGLDSDNLVTSRIIRQIISINGDSNRNKIVNFVNNMHISDSRLFRNNISKIEPDIIMRDSFTCKECNEVSEVDIPITAEFFWPAGDR